MQASEVKMAEMRVDELTADWSPNLFDDEFNETLAALGLATFLKTSGGKGLHVITPIRRLDGWHEVERLCRAKGVRRAHGFLDRLVAKQGPKNRQGNIFIDYLCNHGGATTACTWTARSRPGMGVSVPLAWSELTALKRSRAWNLRNVDDRLDVDSPPWQAYSHAARSLAAPMKKVLGRQ